MNINPTISVVIPCYNDGVFLLETLEQLANQTFKDFETIIVNDGSTDPKTLQIFEQITASNKATVLHKTNGRLAMARNYGIKHAKGKYLVIHDADDYFEPTFFAKALKILQENPTVGAVTCWVQQFGLGKKKWRPRGGTVKNFLFSNESTASIMTTKAIIDITGGYDETMLLGMEDWEHNLQITKAGYSFHVIHEFLFNYRLSKKSMLLNDTMPNAEKIMTYMVNKHNDIYLKNIIEMMLDKTVLYTEERVSVENIAKMIKNRISKNYKQ